MKPTRREAFTRWLIYEGSDAALAVLIAGGIVLGAVVAMAVVGVWR